MSLTTDKPAFSFLQGGGQMGELIRQHNWALTPLGEPQTWPQSLRTTLSILLHSKFPMFLYWKKELLCFYNDAYRPSLGISGKHPDALGKPAETVWKEAWPVIKPLIDQVLSGGEATWSEDQLVPIYRNGQIENVYWTCSYSAVKDESGHPAGVLATCVETTKTVEALKRLLPSQQRFENLIKQATIGIIILLGDELRVEMVNEAYALLVDRVPADLLGRPLFDVIPEAKPYFIDLLDKARLRGESVYLYDHPYFIYVNGQKKEGYLHVVYQPYREVDGSIIGVMVTCQDVTYEVIARRKLEEAEERTRLAMEAADMGMYELNLLTNQMLTSTRFNEIFDVHDTHEHSSFVNAFHPDDLAIREQAHKDSLQNGLLDYTARIIRKSGKVHWVRVKGRQYFDEAKKPIRLLGVVQDITEQKELERQKDSFLGIASHELKTPVTSMKAYAQLMEKVFRRNGDAKNAELVSKMNYQANRLSSLIADLLDVTKINNGRLQFNLTTFNFNEMVQEVVEEVQRTSPNHEIQMKLAFADLVYGDRDRTGQVLINLITNAIKYSPNTRHIVVYTQKKGTEVQLCVQDFGIGISADKKDLVFEQFYRVSGSKEHTFPGLGLGLYISSEIIKRMHGRIWVNSTEGKGSTFCFAVPAQQE